MKELKAKRATFKQNVTKHLSALSRLVAERNDVETRQRLSTVKTEFSNFEDSHKHYEEMLPDDHDIDVELDYFLEVESRYVSGVSHANMWLESLDINDKPQSTKDQIPIANSIDLTNLFSIPKVRLDVFKGDPLEFQSFMAIFDESVDSKLTDGQQKLTRLLQYTDGPAKAAIRNCALIKGDDGYKQAREILFNRFGNNHLVSRKIIDDLKGGKVVNNPAQLQQFADDLNMAETALSKIRMLSEIDNQHSILELLQRCPETLQSKWHKLALDNKDQSDTYPGFPKFVSFVGKFARHWNDPVYGKDSLKSFKQTHCKFSTCQEKSSGELAESTNFNVSGPQPFSTQVCYACKGTHKLWRCDVFKSMRPQDRFEMVKGGRLCFNCLLPNHITNDCPKQSFCSVPNCNRKHSKFLHLGKITTLETVDTLPDETSRFTRAASNSSENVDSGATGAFGGTVYLPIVPIKANGVKTFALLDSGSTNSFVTEEFATKLGLEGEPRNYVLNTVAARHNMVSNIVHLDLSSIDDTFSQKTTKFLVVPDIPSKSAPKRVNLSKFPHLKGVRLSYVPEGAEISVLIGQDCPNIIAPRDVRYNPHSLSDPFATKSVFGWCLNGPVGDADCVEVSANFIDLDRAETLWSEDSFDTDERGHSIEDLKVLSLWDEQVDRIGEKYCLPIPWKYERPDFPNNRPLARHRLSNLNSRLDKLGLKNAYDNEIKGLVDNGYAETVPEHELRLNDGSVFYLPHHPVLKKSGKVRPVFDCACKYQGTSLNNQCLQGPDLTNKLITVLLKFRQFKFAITADIEAMYLQVKIPMQDRNALRFLWYDDHGSVVEYRMTSHLFGGVWSASSSVYALRRTVLDYQTSPLITDTVLGCFYVDDLLKSVASRAEAKEVIEGTKTTLRKGGFNLTKFMVNSEDISNEVDIEDRAGQM